MERKEELETMRYEMVKLLHEFVKESVRGEMTSDARIAILPEVIKALMSFRY